MVAGAEGIHRATVDAVLGNQRKPFAMMGEQAPPYPSFRRYGLSWVRNTSRSIGDCSLLVGGCAPKPRTT